MPEVFGRTPEVEWKVVLPSEEAQLVAAQYQHRWVCRIREKLRQRSASGRKKYAAEVGVSYDRLLKVLRGETILRIDDLAAADLALGEISEFAILQTKITRRLETERVKRLEKEVEQVVRNRNLRLEAQRQAPRK